MDVTETRIDIDKPRYDQDTYNGRAKHFFITTNPLNILATPGQLNRAKEVVDNYRAGKLGKKLTEDELWKAKHLYDSAFHPDSGEKMFIIGRMSAQVPMNMTITGCMMTFYKSTPQVLLWQWINQTFNAVVNYTNRSGDSGVPVKQLGLSYILATTGAATTALGLNRNAHRFPPLIARYVPFAAVACANCINIPCMRSRELLEGIPVFTSDGEKVGESKKASKKAIAQVTFSRITMAAPSMLFPPIIMQHLEKGKFLKTYKFMNAPVQVLLVGCALIFSTPLCCALFPQKSSMSVSSLEPELQEKAKALGKSNDKVYFNKGL